MSTVLYRNPVALDSARHAGWRLRPMPDFRYARTINAIPINLVEFPQVAKFYPIGFITGQPTIFPVAIVGMREENLFVDAQGQWKPGAYIPAFIRRYPFILGEDPAGRFALCVEDSPEVLTTTGGAPLFEGGQPSDATRQALEFCNACHTAGLATAQFTKAVVEAGLLVDREANAALSGGRRQVKLEGFKVVDQDRIQAMSVRTLGQWNARNWLVPLYAHLQSMQNWNDLLELLTERPLEVAG